MEYKVKVEDKVATVVGDSELVSYNIDNSILFEFDSNAWTTEKTARFVYKQDGKLKYIETEFTGNSVPVPMLKGIEELYVGVYVDGMYTSTPARLVCRKSILCDTEASEGVNESEIALQTIAVTPAEGEPQVFTPDDGFQGFSSFTVYAIPSEYIIPRGTLDINAAGEFDVRIFDKVNVSEAAGVVSGTINITTNNSLNDVSRYQYAFVNTPPPEGYILPSGSKTITENGLYTVEQNASVNVQVASGGGSTLTLVEGYANENGEYTPGMSGQAYSKFTVDVDTSQIIKNMAESFVEYGSAQGVYISGNSLKIVNVATGDMTSGSILSYSTLTDPLFIYGPNGSVTISGQTEATASMVYVYADPSGNAYIKYNPAPASGEGGGSSDSVLYTIKGTGGDSYAINDGSNGAFYDYFNSGTVTSITLTNSTGVDISIGYNGEEYCYVEHNGVRALCRGDYLTLGSNPIEITAINVTLKDNYDVEAEFYGYPSASEKIAEVQAVVRLALPNTFTVE